MGGAYSLYRYCSDSPGTNLDPSGLRPIEFKFDAFIPGRFGAWVPEPFPFGLLGYYFGTDMRTFGQAGSSRLASEGTVESTQIGKVADANVVTDTGWSYRRYWSDNQWIVLQAKAVPASSHELYNDYDMRTNPTRCYTLVVIKASAAYPFISLAPNIDYHVSFEFLVVGKDLVQISVSGVHDAFPNYEAIADGTLLYKYDTTWGGPGTGLTLGYLLGQSRVFGHYTMTVTAETDPCCAIQ